MCQSNRFVTIVGHLFHIYNGYDGNSDVCVFVYDLACLICVRVHVRERVCICVCNLGSFTFTDTEFLLMCIVCDSTLNLTASDSSSARRYFLIFVES